MGPTSKRIKTVKEIRSNFFANYEGIALGAYMPSCVLCSFIEDTKCNKEAPTHHTGFSHMESNFSWPLMQRLRNVPKLRSCNEKNVSIVPDRVLQALLAAQTLNPA